MSEHDHQHDDTRPIPPTGDPAGAAPSGAGPTGPTGAAPSGTGWPSGQPGQPGQPGAGAGQHGSAAEPGVPDPTSPQASGHYGAEAGGHPGSTSSSPERPGTPTGGPAGHEGQGHQHRYQPALDTARYDTSSWGNGGSSFFGGPTGPEQPSSSRARSGRNGGLTAAVLIGALVVGGLAGLGGAATYDLVDQESSGSSSGNANTATSVVERNDTPAPAGSVEDVANSVLPSVVKINVRGMQGAGSGSGVILSEDGEILTNYHVVEVAEQGGGTVSVGFNDGSTAPAEVIGTDPLTDLAVIKAQDVSGLTPAKLGQSGNLDVGEQVVAIGSPFGLDATVTSGIVSALHRPVSVSGQGSAMNTAYPAIQTDAAINPGNSGGPLVNMNGEVVGINSSIRTSSSAGEGGSIGLGFAIPLDEVVPIVDQLRNGEAPTHARLGVSVTDASSQDGLLSGAGISDVSPGSAADEAGLEPGDVVTKVDDQPITDATSLVATIRGHRPGDTVTLTVVRDDKERTLEATLDSDEGDPAS
ncbi:MAG: trypsin-like peptidase domain-containing protein [Actinomycetota bacterium]